MIKASKDQERVGCNLMMDNLVEDSSLVSTEKTTNGEIEILGTNSKLENIVTDEFSSVSKNKNVDELSTESKVEDEDKCVTNSEPGNIDDLSKSSKIKNFKGEKNEVSAAVQLTKIEENEDSDQCNTQNEIKKTETKDSTDDMKTKKDLKSIIKNEHIELKQNGKLSSTSKNIISKAMPAQEVKVHKEAKPVTKKDSEKRVILPRDLTNLSIGNISTASADPPVQSTSVPQPAERQSVITQSDSYIRSAIPSLPLGLAVVYFILNIIIPGSGTILSGFSILCCGECRVQTKDDMRLITLCVNVCVGVSQLFTITFLLVGWFWSIAWGVDMVILAVELRKRKKQEREKELQKIAVTAFTGDNVRSFFSGRK